MSASTFTPEDNHALLDWLEKFGRLLNQRLNLSPAQITDIKFAIYKDILIRLSTKEENRHPITSLLDIQLEVVWLTP